MKNLFTKILTILALVMLVSACDIIKPVIRTAPDWFETTVNNQLAMVRDDDLLVKHAKKIEGLEYGWFEHVKENIMRPVKNLIFESLPDDQNMVEIDGKIYYKLRYDTLIPLEYPKH